MNYQVKDFYAQIDIEEYIQRFRNEEYFLNLCRQCPNYNSFWSCPPFDFDIEEFLLQYDLIHIIATKITPHLKGLPLNRVNEFLLPEKIRLEKILLEEEKKSGGRALLTIGNCHNCECECQRKSGIPCLHPDKVRPSIEAFGFNITKTLEELFSLPIQWSSDNVIPDHLTLVTALVTDSRYTPTSLKSALICS